jgi:hypothetical protein
MIGRTGMPFPNGDNTFINLISQVNGLTALFTVNSGGNIFTAFAPESNAQDSASSKVIKGETITKSCMQFTAGSSAEMIGFSYDTNAPILVQGESWLVLRSLGGGGIDLQADAGSMADIEGVPGNGADLTNTRLRLMPGNPSAVGLNEPANLIEDDSFPNLAPSPSAPPPDGSSNCASTGFATDPSLGVVTTATFNNVIGSSTTNQFAVLYNTASLQINDLLCMSFLVKASITGLFEFFAAQGEMDYGPITLQAGVWTRIFFKVGNGSGFVLNNVLRIFPGDTHAATIQLARLTTLVNPTPVQAQILSTEHRFNPGTNNASIIVTKTVDFTLGAAENWVINNKAGSTCTVTLPDPTIILDRKITFTNYQAQTLVSASANVVPLVGGAASTAILAATAGKWATLLSNGTNWAIMQSN